MLASRSRVSIHRAALASAARQLGSRIASDNTIDADTDPREQARAPFAVSTRTSPGEGPNESIGSATPGFVAATSQRAAVLVLVALRNSIPPRGSLHPRRNHPATSLPTFSPAV